MGSTTAAGTGYYVSASLPATDDAAGYAALPWTEVGGAEKIGTIGATTEKVTFKPLKGPIQKHKGSTDYGSINPSMAWDETDPGQTIMRTAGDPANNAMLAHKIVYPSGAIRYSSGRVFGIPENADNADSMIMFNPTVEFSTKVVRVGA